MTIVVYRDGVMAADTGVFTEGCLAGRAQKIGRRSDGALVACAGPNWATRLFREWFLAGADPATKPTDIEDFEALTVAPDGAVTIWQHKRIEPCSVAAEQYYVLGSGHEIARGALWLGATAEEAAEAACAIHVYCGAPIQVERLHPKAAPAERAIFVAAE